MKWIITFLLLIITANAVFADSNEATTIAEQVRVVQCQDTDDCEPYFSHCSCSYECTSKEIPLLDCAMECPPTEEPYVIPDCGCNQGQCEKVSDVNKKCYSNEDCNDDETCSIEKCNSPGFCKDTEAIACNTQYTPVCGCDGKTYSNDCVRQLAGAGKLYDGECKEECVQEGGWTTGAVGPEYATYCCDGLKAHYPYDSNSNIVGSGSLCYNPEKGTPVCMHQGSKSEGWYYSNGGLIAYGICSQDIWDLKISLDDYKITLGDKINIQARITSDAEINAKVYAIIEMSYVDYHTSVEPESTGGKVEVEEVVVYTGSDMVAEKVEIVNSNIVAIPEATAPSRGSGSSSSDTRPTGNTEPAQIVNLEKVNCEDLECDCEDDDDCYCIVKFNCNYAGSFTPRNAGLYKMTVHAINGNDERIEVIKFNVVEEDVVRVYTDDKFELDIGMKAQVVNHNNMIIDFIGADYAICPTCEGCPCEPDVVKLLVYVPCRNPNMDCMTEAQEFSIKVGETREVFGAKLSVLGLDSDTAIFLVTSGAQGKYARLGEKFSLASGDSVKITDYNYLKMTATEYFSVCNVNNCANYVNMLATISSGSYNSERSYTIRESDSVEINGAEVSFLEFDTDGGIFVVEKNVDDELVEVTISPSEQMIVPGDSVKYIITVKDRHPQVDCGNVDCMMASYGYNIQVNGLPFYKEFPTRVEVFAGDENEIVLYVKPYEGLSEAHDMITGEATEEAIERSTKEAKTAFKKVMIEDVSKDEAMGQTNVMVQPPVDRSYQFSVTATLSTDRMVQDTAQATLNVKTGGEEPDDQVQIHLYEGWNLISLPGKLVRFDVSSMRSQKLMGFVYLKEKQEYVSLNKAQDILGDQLNEYLAKNAFWVYSKDAADLVVVVDMELDFDINLVAGWNLLPITQDMVGGYFSDLMQDCEINRMYDWNEKEQKWNVLDDNNIFYDYQIGYGILVDSESYCRMDGPELLPPSMPR